MASQSSSKASSKPDGREAGNSEKASETSMEPLRFFKEDSANHNFGVANRKSGAYSPKSDFSFKLKILLRSPEVTGYVCHVTGEKEEFSRPSFFSIESTNTKRDFMRMINQTCGGGNFTCSFSDREMSEYIQFRKREDQVEVKSVASILGEQPNGNVWILNKECYLDEYGRSLNPSDSPFYWLSDHMSGQGIAPAGNSCVVNFPLETNVLQKLILTMFPVMEHNAMSAVLMLGACAMSLHYKTILDTNLNCPVTVAHGPSGTGKTTALLSALSILGAHKNNFYSRGTKESFVSILSKQTIPIGLDDPQSIKNLSELLIDLYGGAKNTSIKRGASRPLGTVLTSANFTSTESARYASRCILIPFCHPPINVHTASKRIGYARLARLMEEASKTAGAVVHLKKKFLEEGDQEIRQHIEPYVSNHLRDAYPRVHRGYFTLIWFTLQLLDVADLSFLRDEILRYFEDVVTVNVLKFQNQAAKFPPQEKKSLAELGDLSSGPQERPFIDFLSEIMIKEMKNLSLQEILTFCRGDRDKFRGRDAFALHYYVPSANFLVPHIGKIRWMIQSETCGEVNCTRNFLDTAHVVNENVTRVHASGTQKNAKQKKCDLLCWDVFPEEQRLLLKKAMSASTAMVISSGDTADAASAKPTEERTTAMAASTAIVIFNGDTADAASAQPTEENTTAMSSTIMVISSGDTAKVTQPEDGIADKRKGRGLFSDSEKKRLKKDPKEQKQNTKKAVTRSFTRKWRENLS